MAATSPYTQNDYQAVSNFRPYELPINDIFKSLSAQNMFWEAGAARVKAYHDNALNLKLSLEPNKEIRRKYIDDAEKQLTKLSSMDVADPAVQKQGFALYKPLFQDEGVIFDDLTTRHYDKVRDDAMMYRSKDNGKGYSDINFQYAMQGYGEFLNSKDRMAGKSFYQNRKEYTPYHDYTEDFSKSLKDCKPSSIETTSPTYGKGNAMSGYMQEVYTKSLSAGQVQGCLEAGLSPNAKRQLQIEGSVSYKDNLPVLAQDTAMYLSGVSGNYSNQLQQLSGSKALILAKKDLSEQEKAIAIEAIDNQVKTVQEELDRTNRNVEKIQAGDYTDIMNSFDNYAGTVYSFKKLYKKALSSAFEEIRSNYKADPVQLNAIRFSQEKTLRQMDFTYDVSMEQMRNDHDKEMKLLDLMYGTNSGKSTGSGTDVFRNPLTGEVTMNPNLLRETGNLDNKPEANEKIYTELTERVSSLNEQDNNNNLRLYNNLVSRAERDKPFRETMLKGFNYGVTDDEWARFKTEHASNKFASQAGGQQGLQETTWFKTYTEGQPDDEDVNKWSYDNTIIESGIAVLNRKLEIGEAQVNKELGGDFNALKRDKIASIKPVTLSDGTVITASDVELARSNPGTNVKGLVFKSANSLPFFKGAGMQTPLGTGKEKEQMDKNRVFSLYRTTYDSVKTVDNKLKSKRAEVYNNLGFDREPWYFTPNEKAPILETIKSVLPKDGEGKDLNVKIISSDFSGGIKVSIPGVKKDKDKFITELRNAGVGTSVEATGDGVVTIKGTNYNLVQQAINNPILRDAAYQLNTIAETSAFQQTQPGAKVPNGDIKVPVMVRGKQQTMLVETYKNDTQPEFRVFLEGATDPRPYIIASNPYELFEKIARSPFDLNKPIK